MSCLLLVLGTSQLSAQKRLLSDQQEVTNAAIHAIEVSMSNGHLFELKEKYQITGTYVFDITIRKKGEVAAVFAVENNGGTIAFQNRIKDTIKEMKMGFKMPKNKNYKFTYQFNFNH